MEGLVNLIAVRKGGSYHDMKLDVMYSPCNMPVYESVSYYAATTSRHEQHSYDDDIWILNRRI
jgi:hypothetical protein